MVERAKPGCWFCETGPGPICDACIDRADAELDAHFASNAPHQPREVADE